MDLSATPLKHRILCVNCNICVNTFRRHIVLQLDTREISLISDWISPVIVSENDFICDPCLELVRQAVHKHLNGSNEGIGLSRLGHKQVCQMCGRSLRNRQSHLILQKQSSLQAQIMVDIVCSKLAPRQISATDRICHSCWQKTKRATNRSLQADDNRSVAENQPIPFIVKPEIITDPMESQDNVVVKIEPEDPLQIQHLDVQQNIEPENRPQSKVFPGSSKIQLPNYRRAANTASHCVFTGCEQLRDLHTVSDLLRATLLANYSYYIPKLARVCSNHLHGNNWDVLYDSSNSMNTFTADQVEHIFSFVNAFKPSLDLNSMETVEQMDDRLFGYWFGITKVNFISMLHELPQVLETHRGILGLGAILIKMKTGDSNERLSTLLDVPRRTLERIMGIVRETLPQDFVPRKF